MRIWSILLIKSDLKWCINLSSSLFIFQLLGDCHCWWTCDSLRAHVAKFTVDFGWLVAIESIKILRVKIDWNYNFVGLLHYPVPFGFSLFGHFLEISFILLKLLFGERITDEGSVPETRKWSILLFKSDSHGMNIWVEVSLYYKMLCVVKCAHHCFPITEIGTQEVQQVISSIPETDLGQVTDTLFVIDHKANICNFGYYTSQIC